MLSCWSSGTRTRCCDGIPTGCGSDLKIVYLLMRWLFGLTVLVFRGDQARDAELLVLRHENAVLRRHTDRVRFRSEDCLSAHALVIRPDGAGVPRGSGEGC